MDFQDRNLLSDSIFASAGWKIEPLLVNDVETNQGVDDDDDGGEVEGSQHEIHAEVVMACKAGK